MRGRQVGKAVIGAFRQPQQYAAVVVLILIPANKPGLTKAVNQFHRAVVADAQALRQIANCHRSAAREALDRKQRLMLARSQTGSVRLDLAELEEAADQITKLGEPLVVLLLDC